MKLLMKFLLLCVFVSCHVSMASERITSFISDITVRSDASLRVKEAITVQAAGDQIKRGIVREFPTRYKDRWGNDVEVGFTVESVLLDGEPVAYHLADAVNGVRMFIGEKHALIKPELHTYIITYTTNRQLGFFEQRDELYWNVTGNGWRFPIDKAWAIVHLPQGVDPKTIQYEAYTGYQGTQESAYRVTQDEHGIVVFETTKALDLRQGFTVVATWPEGFITRPTWRDHVRENWPLIWMFLGFLILIIMYIVASIRFTRSQNTHTVIPLFYPPKGMSPGAVRYFMNMRYDEIVLASDIVNMAVHGFLEIEYKNFQYTLKKKTETPDPQWQEEYGELQKIMFASQDSLPLSAQSYFVVERMVDSLKKRLSTSLGSYFLSNMDYFVWGILIAVIFAFPALTSNAPAAIFGGVVMLIIASIATHSLRGYSTPGLKIKAEIEGFKLFLSTTEEDRIAMVGTPPTKTPELYETYLPYAMALRCEKQWSAQFAPMFQLMQKQGMLYHPLWFHGGNFNDFRPSTFSSQVGYAYSTPISSSSGAPGSSSGFGGRGSSGGGGGGGGGGGW